ncbi:hypothetical protein NECAME_01808 [Necator americanus]|uniref:Uncharacterized protein n=1 Tax=Necator americanus TaxID=51031 RepID=W2TQV3_NECAM|nr:hypothetical protein NECAME_01808 [Necator americanus]ETN83501.1 hypothetical protein NECAME_01808 [Necator americanus]
MDTLGYLLSQQRLPGCHLLFTGRTVLSLTIFIGFLCITLGCVLQSANSDVLFRRIEYGNCSKSKCEVDFELDQPWKGTVYFYYRLRHFYKTHRRIQRNVCREQLIGLHPKYCKYVSGRDIFTLRYLNTEEIVPFTTEGITSKEEELYYSYYAKLAPNQSWCDHEIQKQDFSDIFLIVTIIFIQIMTSHTIH